jgi:hypothetical protein
MADAPHPATLAGDDDRERSSALLSRAVVEGRLTLEEFTDRVGQAQAARTQHELADLTQDLPATAQPTALATTPARHVAFCSRLERRGHWELPERSSFRCVCGTIVLDLSQARLAGPDSQLEVFNLFGTVTVIVPEGVDVSVDGGGMFASQVIEPPSARALVAGAPKLRISARGPGGTLYVRSRC